MPLIPVDDQSFLRDKFAKELVNPVNILLFTQHDTPSAIPGPECMYCKETRELVEEISSLSDKINLRIYDFVADAEKARQMGIDKIPAITFDGDSGGRVRYYGIPAGYEFPSLIEDIIDISRHSTGLSQETRESLQKLDKDVDIQVFVTPT